MQLRTSVSKSAIPVTRGASFYMIFVASASEKDRKAVQFFCQTSYFCVHKSFSQLSVKMQVQILQADLGTASSRNENV